MEEVHNTTLTRQLLVDNTTIIHSNRDPKRIEIIEAIHIRDFTPAINTQKNQRLEKLALWGTKQQVEHTRQAQRTRDSESDSVNVNIE